MRWRVALAAILSFPFPFGNRIGVFLVGVIVFAAASQNPSVVQGREQGQISGDVVLAESIRESDKSLKEQLPFVPRVFFVHSMGGGRQKLFGKVVGNSWSGCCADRNQSPTYFHRVNWRRQVVHTFHNNKILFHFGEEGHSPAVVFKTASKLFTSESKFSVADYFDARRTYVQKNIGTFGSEKSIALIGGVLSQVSCLPHQPNCGQPKDYGESSYENGG